MKYTWAFSDLGQKQIDLDVLTGRTGEQREEGAGRDGEESTLEETSAPGISCSVKSINFTPLFIATFNIEGTFHSQKVVAGVCEPPFPCNLLQVKSGL